MRCVLHIVIVGELRGLDTSFFFLHWYCCCQPHKKSRKSQRKLFVLFFNWYTEYFLVTKHTNCSKINRKLPSFSWNLITTQRDTYHLDWLIVEKRTELESCCMRFAVRHVLSLSCMKLATIDVWLSLEQNSFTHTYTHVYNSNA